MLAPEGAACGLLGYATSYDPLPPAPRRRPGDVIVTE